MPSKKHTFTCAVCGIELGERPKFKTEHKGETFYVCSQNDLKEFRKRPQVYSWKFGSVA